MDVDEQPLRIMADSNILIAGVLKPRWFFEFLGHAIRGDFQLVLAPQTVAEVLRWAEAKGGRRQRALEFFLAVCRFELAPDPSPEEVQANTALVRDVTDVPVALSAIKARVDYLVTNDDDFHAEDTRAELERQGIQVMLVGTFLAEVLGWRSRELEAIRHREWSDLLSPPPLDSVHTERG
jgi:predicted nucleic acid-binding protein